MAVNLFLAKEKSRGDLLSAMGGRPALEEVSLVRSRPKTVNVPPKPLSPGLELSRQRSRKGLMTPAEPPRHRRPFSFADSVSPPDDKELSRKLLEFHARYRVATTLDNDYLDALDRSPDLCATPTIMSLSEVRLFVRARHQPSCLYPRGELGLPSMGFPATAHSRMSRASH